MSDRELLEAAAKAAGIELVWGGIYYIGPDEVDCTDVPYKKSIDTDVSDEYWNPLTDDGDALRLAVKLRLMVHISGVLVDGVHVQSEHGAAKELYGNDPYAATRRAITCAAAAIGAAS